MPRYLQNSFWLLSLSVLALILWWRPGQTDRTNDSAFALPDDPPDLYIESVNQTLFNQQGLRTSVLTADSLAFYEHRGSGDISNPRMNQLQDDVLTWSIQSRRALLHDSGAVEFMGDVEVREENAAEPWLLETNWLRLEQQGRFATTPSPVKLSQGSQLATGTGLDAWLAGDNPELTLKSEVAIQYEMDAR